MNSRYVILIAIFSLAVFSISAKTQRSRNRTIKSFEIAKRKLAQIYGYRGRTFYCHCTYVGERVNANKCGLKSPWHKARLTKVEWEHIVPASKFKRRFRSFYGHEKCRTKSGKRYYGRRCAKKISKAFRKVEGDLYNLVPASGAINGYRSNKNFGWLPSISQGVFGKCKLKITKRKIEPRRSIRGNIARVYMYMHQAYPGLRIISGRNRRMLQRWHRQDPVNRTECRIGRKIARIQKNVNPFLKKACDEAGL